MVQSFTAVVVVEDDDKFLDLGEKGYILGFVYIQAHVHCEVVEELSSHGKPTALVDEVDIGELSNQFPHRTISVDEDGVAGPVDHCTGGLPVQS